MIEQDSVLINPLFKVNSFHSRICFLSASLSLSRDSIVQSCKQMRSMIHRQYVSTSHHDDDLTTYRRENVSERQLDTTAVKEQGHRVDSRRFRLYGRRRQR
jgi:hypothetical protein